MKPLSPTDIVFSEAGHDKGKAFMVVRAEGTRAFLVDGKLRKLHNPKEKSLKHLSFGREGDPQLAEALKQGAVTDRKIRKELAIFRKGRE